MSEVLKKMVTFSEMTYWLVQYRPDNLQTKSVQNFC